MLKRYFYNLIKRWMHEREALAAVEGAMIFPIMLAIFVGVFDVGNGILANQKTVRASQVVADLIARTNIVSDNDIAEAIEAGRLAFEPMDSSAYGVDIISMRFDELGTPEIVWRETSNMTPIADPIGAVAALQAPDEGLVMVAVEFEYEPIFAGHIISTFDMQEVAFSRGRRSPVVNKE